MENVHVVGVILAGGMSRRFGADKCVALLGERPIIEWVIERARHQVQALLLNANRAIKTRSKIERLADQAPGEGPLAGIVGALKAADQRGFAHVASFACDTPFFPSDVVERLARVLCNGSGDFAVARCGGNVHRIFALWPVSCLSKFETAFAEGARSMRSIENWLAPAWADFPAGSGPHNDPFFNINTRDNLVIAERWLAGQRAQLRI